MIKDIALNCIWFHKALCSFIKTIFYLKQEHGLDSLAGGAALH